MELTVIDRVPRKVQVDLPYYSKTPAFRYKVISDRKVIVVHMGFELNTCGIETSENTSLAFDGVMHSLSNEEEFNEAFDQVINKLKDEKDR